MELGLSGKAALITGANRGIGAAIALELAKEGVHVCLVARDLTKLNEVATKILGIANVRTAVHAADLREPAAAVDRPGLRSARSVRGFCAAGRPEPVRRSPRSAGTA